jgi:hypothetical protein
MRYLVAMSELDERGILLNCPKCERRNRMRYEGLGKVFRCAALGPLRYGEADAIANAIGLRQVLLPRKGHTFIQRS